MFRIRTFNQISAKGLEQLPASLYSVSKDASEPHGIILRSHKLLKEELNPDLEVVSRAGAGYNNIPVDLCTEKGIAVLVTPGANANSVKELVLAALLNASRNVLESHSFVRSLSDLHDNESLHKAVEGQKRQFRGKEIAGKTLGIIGLGNIGGRVAQAALGLRMKVLGYDPALSIDAAWRIPNQVERVDDINALLSRSSYITLQTPLLESTRHLINRKTLESCKTGAVLLNFARDEIVDTQALADALRNKKLAGYFGDFPQVSLLGLDNAFLTPHLGASTVEAEENCAVMAADQLSDFLENGNITHSVNLPTTLLDRTTENRLAIVNRNIPAMLGQILSVLARHKVNVLDMLNKSRQDIAYNLIDIEPELKTHQLEEIRKIEGVIRVRQY